MDSQEKQFKDKIFKDPVYGYISIPRKYIPIIDSSSFQRLRRISQTSYSPLYSSALHNRFVHSMGVFHLAMIAMNTLRNDTDSTEYFKGESEEEAEWSFDFYEIFELAALLHDVGHSPFSHTGEKYYLCDEEHEDCSQLHNELKALVNNDNFTVDIDALEVEYANPHEIMSAIIGLNHFPGFFNDNSEARSFFARCITGYQYGNSETKRTIGPKEKLLNCLITLLNSKVIDVDKLDYLIRDAYIIGYDTINIDYERLLKSVTIVQNINENLYELAFHKSAVSVIENVIYARDSEKKWIQGHPVVLYESYLVQEIIKEFINTHGDLAFSSKALSSEGIITKYGKGDDGSFIRLLCDDDIITFAKNQIPNNPIAKQYFERSLRMHAFWKSEAEFNTKLLKDMTESGKKAVKLIMDKTIRPGKEDRVVIVNDQFKNSILKSRLKDEEKANSRGLNIKTSLTEYDAQLKMTDFLLNYADEKHTSREFVIMSANSFSSGFDSREFKSLKIKFDGDHFWRLDKAIPTLDFDKKKINEEEPSLFFIFYSRNDKEDYSDLCERLTECFNSIGKELKLS